MIYETIPADAPIQQGDVFSNIPKIEVSLASLSVALPTGGTRQMTWRDALQSGSETILSILPLEPVTAIAITQNCDAIRSDSIVLSQIFGFTEATGKAPTTPKNWKTVIKELGRQLRLFYLPSSSEVGFDEPKVCDFGVLLRIPRRDLEEMRDCRVGRLNSLATEHFRETLAQYFRRYPYNEWYPLTKDQFATYVAEIPEAEPYPWQK
jgi:hypothetical protein